MTPLTVVTDPADDEGTPRFTSATSWVTTPAEFLLRLNLGASLTELTVNVIVRAIGSVSLPPLVVPPSSCTLNVKPNEVPPAEFLSSVGVKLTLPNEKSCAEIVAGNAETSTPFNRSVPFSGAEGMIALWNWFGGGGCKSFGSLN